MNYKKVPHPDLDAELFSAAVLAVFAGGFLLVIRLAAFFVVAVCVLIGIIFIAHVKILQLMIAAVPQYYFTRFLMIYPSL